MSRNKQNVALEQALAQGLAGLGLSLPAEAQARLLQFIALLAKWNRAYNLTAVREPEVMLPKHLLDSLAVLPYVQGPQVLDVGSGAGLPGIPLALALPDAQFTLLDSNGKKTRFMQQAVLELALGNVTVVQARVEDHPAGPGFDTVLARAFAAVPQVLALAGRLCAPHGRLLLMKGVYPAEELRDLPPGYALEKAEHLHVPGLSAERHVLLIRRDALRG